METSHSEYLLQKGHQGKRGQISGDHRTRIYNIGKRLYSNERTIHLNNKYKMTVYTWKLQLCYASAYLRRRDS